MDYQDLEVWQLARELTIDVHRMILADESLHQDLLARMDTLIAKLVVFTRGVEANHQS